jgi:hypothetical protein
LPRCGGLAKKKLVLPRCRVEPRKVKVLPKGIDIANM